MNTIKIKYRCNGKKYILKNEKSPFLDADIKFLEDRISVILKPKAEIELLGAEIAIKHKFAKGEIFFANGYQSWSTSKEYSKGELQLGVSPIIPFNIFRKKAGNSTDIWFCKDEKMFGVFHSHCYTYFKNHLANGDLLFYGSLAEKSGYTVFHMNTHTGNLTIKKDVEGAIISDQFVAFDIVIEKGSMDHVFDNYFDKLQIAKPRFDHFSGYTSWYNYFKNITEEIIMRDLVALDSVSDKIDIYQIDDGYQNFVGDWTELNSTKFPKGMQYIADEIHKKGYKAGIWLAPLNAETNSNVFKNHQDWLVCDNKGQPLKVCDGWSGAYALDIYNADARQHIKDFFDIILNQWGYDMVKLDFLYSGAQHPRNGKTRGEVMHDTMQLLRECCGDKIILGCGVPLAPSFGVVDACRISCDMNTYYLNKMPHKIHLNDEYPSTQMAINNSIFRHHLNGRAFTNDPDVFFLRDINIEFTDQQKELLYTINHIYGNVLFMSDNVADYDHDKIDLLGRIFAKSQYKIVNVDRDRRFYKLTLEDKDHKSHIIKFDIKTGKNNIKSLI